MLVLSWLPSSSFRCHAFHLSPLRWWWLWRIRYLGNGSKMPTAGNGLETPWNWTWLLQMMGLGKRWLPFKIWCLGGIHIRFQRCTYVSNRVSILHILHSISPKDDKTMIQSFRNFLFQLGTLTSYPKYITTSSFFLPLLKEGFLLPANSPYTDRILPLLSFFPRWTHPPWCPQVASVGLSCSCWDASCQSSHARGEHLAFIQCWEPKVDETCLTRRCDTWTSHGTCTKPDQNFRNGHLGLKWNSMFQHLACWGVGASSNIWLAFSCCGYVLSSKFDANAAMPRWDQGTKAGCQLDPLL